MDDPTTQYQSPVPPPPGPAPESGWNAPPPKSPKPKGKRGRMPWVVGGAVLTIALLAAYGAGSQDTEPTPTAAAVVSTPTPVPTPTPTPEPTPTPTPTPEPRPDDEVWQSYIDYTSGAEWTAYSDAFDVWTDSESIESAQDVVDTAAALVAHIESWMDVRSCFAAYHATSIQWVSGARDAAQAQVDGDMAESMAILSRTVEIPLIESLNTAGAECTGTPMVTPPPTPAPQPVKVSGKGSRTTKPFTLPEGDYEVIVSGKATDRWGGNVIIELMPVGGGFLDTEFLFNEIADRGKYKWDTVVYGVDGGKYYLDAMMPGGAWTVTFKPLAP